MVRFEDVKKRAKIFQGGKPLSVKANRFGLSPQARRVQKIRFFIGIVFFLVFFAWVILFTRTLILDSLNKDKAIAEKERVERESAPREVEITYRPRTQ